MYKLRIASVSVAALAMITLAKAETVEVKYRGPVDLKTFACQDVTRSSFIHRVCYDKANQYMVIQLRSTYYHYCELPEVTHKALMDAPSMGRYYNANIKGTGSDGPYDCRTHRVPRY
jgi:hypothetical protein